MGRRRQASVDPIDEKPESLRILVVQEDESLLSSLGVERLVEELCVLVQGALSGELFNNTAGQVAYTSDLTDVTLTFVTG